MTQRPSKWSALLSGVPSTSPSRVTSDDEDAVVQPMLTTDQLQKRIRELNNNRIRLQGEAETIETEYRRVTTEMVRLQTQLIEQTKEHMQGWTIHAKLNNPECAS